MKKYIKPSLFVENMAHLAALSTSCKNDILSFNDSGMYFFEYQASVDILGGIAAYYDSENNEYIFAQSGCTGYSLDPTIGNPNIWTEVQQCEHVETCYHVPTDLSFFSSL